ncbi:MAG: cytochrome C oxidase subunit IV family protein [Candidatus Wallbacteria bacterium]|nr:cytochrome C oxidase subunit IV family protein [Candidatus Wallbacteria bacterium]
MAHESVSRTVYFAVFLILVALLGATVAAAEIDLGRWNFLVAMAIATVKAVLIGIYFMHLEAQSQLTRVFALAGFAWLALLLLLTFSDFATRAGG